jgi:tRNA A37 threonylcarbamoyladenosine biosynthesis protein TsaE
MNSSLFYSLLRNKFPFVPTYNQDIFFQKYFLTEPDNDTIFVLKGYAGTGKTTVISTIVNNLRASIKILAPTGRAAKVIANYSKTCFYDS